MIHYLTHIGLVFSPWSFRTLTAGMLASSLPDSTLVLGAPRPPLTSNPVSKFSSPQKHSKNLKHAVYIDAYAKQQCKCSSELCTSDPSAHTVQLTIKQFWQLIPTDRTQVHTCGNYNGHGVRICIAKFYRLVGLVYVK